jgi:hypothetical protein
MPYFASRKKLSAAIVVDERYPTQQIYFSAWKVIRFFAFVFTTPQFVDVQPVTLRRFEDALKMAANHAAKLNADGEKGVGGGVQGIIVDQNENYFDVRIFPRSDKYHIIIQQDEFGAITIDVPAMRLTDIPSINQVRKVMGQCVQLAESMKR